jgi:hypothetical protein
MGLAGAGVMNDVVQPFTDVSFDPPARSHRASQNPSRLRFIFEAQHEEEGEKKPAKIRQSGEARRSEQKADALGNLLKILLTAGQVHALDGADALFHHRTQ